MSSFRRRLLMNNRFTIDIPGNGLYFLDTDWKFYDYYTEKENIDKEKVVGVVVIYKKKALLLGDKIYTARFSNNDNVYDTLKVTTYNTNIESWNTPINTGLKDTQAINILDPDSIAKDALNHTFKNNLKGYIMSTEESRTFYDWGDAVGKSYLDIENALIYIAHEPFGTGYYWCSSQTYNGLMHATKLLYSNMQLSYFTNGIKTLKGVMRPIFNLYLINEGYYKL